MLSEYFWHCTLFLIPLLLATALKGLESVQNGHLDQGFGLKYFELSAISTIARADGSSRARSGPTWARQLPAKEKAALLWLIIGHLDVGLGKVACRLLRLKHASWVASVSASDKGRERDKESIECVSVCLHFGGGGRAWMQQNTEAQSCEAEWLNRLPSIFWFFTLSLSLWPI